MLSILILKKALGTIKGGKNGKCTWIIWNVMGQTEDVFQFCDVLLIILDLYKFQYVHPELFKCII